MQIDKAMVMDLLRQRGDSAQADQAQAELPQQVDTDQHAGLLQKFGLDPQDLIGMLGGGGGLGGLGGSGGGGGGAAGGLGKLLGG